MFKTGGDAHVYRKRTFTVLLVVSFLFR